MFASPLYLLLLIPWAALVLWLLSGQRQRVGVPFLDLWSGPAQAPRIKRTIQPPPAALACACVAMLLAILAASGPQRAGQRAAAPMTIIIDRGITMAAQQDGQSRRDRLVDQVASVNSARSSSQIIHLIFVPGAEQDSNGLQWAAQVKAQPFSATDTRDLLATAIATALKNGNGPVLALTDQKLSLHDPRLIQVAPANTPQNVGIVRFAAVSTPGPQVMVGLSNQSSDRQANIAIESGDNQVTKSIQLNDAAEQNVFFDLPALADTVEASVNVSDDLVIDNHAYLVRQRAWPKLEPRTALPAELRRMIEVYQKHRPASEGSIDVAITNEQPAPINQPAVKWVDDPAKLLAIGHAKIEVSAQPITAGVNWGEIGADAFAEQSAVDDGWTPIVRAGSLVLVAVRDRPVRQVRVSFNSRRFSQSPDFVIFWTNVFNWLGAGGAEEFVAEPVKMLGPEWRLQTPAPQGNFDVVPGIYRRGDGARRAMNAIDIHFNPPPVNDWRGQLAGFTRTQTRPSSVQNLLILLSMVAVLISAMIWKSKRSRLAIEV